MKIGIVLHPYNEEKPGGMARTIFEWTKALLRADHKNEYVIFLKESPPHTLMLPPGNWRVEVLRPRKFWLEGLAHAPKMDTYLFQTPVLPLFYRPRNSVVIVQDFPYLYLPARSLGEYLWRKVIRGYHRFSLRKADFLVAVSEATKKDIIQHFHIRDSKKITVVHMGFKSICSVSQTPLTLPEQFFLFVGVIKERKNVARVVEAFHGFKKKFPGSSHKLVLAGKAEGDYYERIKTYITHVRLEDEILFLGYLNDGQLSSLYQRAEALVFPSLIEGFGFPVLEAMDCGIPVITTKYMGPSEIAGEAGILVDPFKPDEIQTAFERIFSEKGLRETLREKGLARAKEFSWEKSAHALLSLLEKAGAIEKKKM